MNENKNRHSIRLKHYDYSQNGAYFVTICTQNREILFGDIVGVDPCVDPNLKMELNNVGKMVNDWWLKIPGKFSDIELGIFQIMPNHIHGIIFIDGRTHGSAPTLGTIIQWFKTMTTNDYIDNVKNANWAPFNKRIWQRNYYKNLSLCSRTLRPFGLEHIIRNEQKLSEIRQYIELNPQMWERDRNNPENLYA